MSNTNKSEKFEPLAEQIIHLIGGADNLAFFTHCVTRLRFTLKDRELVNTQSIETFNEVVGCQWSGNQLQVIIGQEVNDAYDLICKKNDLLMENDANKGSKQKLKVSFSDLVDVISGCLTPLIPLLIGAGMIKVLVLLTQITGILDPQSSSYLVLNFVGDSGYYFLPIFVGATAARKFSANIGMGMLMGAVFLHPVFISSVSEGIPLSIAGIPISPVNYANTIFPTIMSVYIMSSVEKFIANHSPNALRSLLQPLLTILIMIPLILCLIGPAGSFLGTYFAEAIMWIYSTTGFLGIAILSMLLPFVIMTGMHTAFVPYMVQSLATIGYEPILSTAMFISNFNQGAAAAAVAIKSRNVQTKSTAISAAVAAVGAGVTEPALFGINMKLKQPLIGAMIGSFVGAGFAGVMHVYAFAFSGSSGIFGLPAFVGTPATNIIFMIISILIGVAVTFVSTLILYQEVGEPDRQDSRQQRDSYPDKAMNQLFAPVSGDIIPMEDIPDPVFASGALGKGIGINPTDNTLFSPADGTVIMVADTKHAIGIRTISGAEILLHVGIDTVEMLGNGFDLKIQVNEDVRKGQELLYFDKRKIEDAGYSPIVIMIVTNGNELQTTEFSKEGSIENTEMIGCAL
ncbi:beta-glucoside-specific PTS transporter subunit IIABC [Trichococcus ilyis]|uniref:PTS system, beta-glucosides-specific IIC component n=1 Tax=Trichococcus ilyis TaxID=640938 RepID=A0A143YKG4_9LACT|nr:beta-glucoside-specific PTS transporter subunit IIABC [Trichococcus ilyis]CZQ91150.1 phosphotransferase system sugar-specific permease eiia type 1 [Trichococcus ilyis]SEI73543.1 PTS system, beta-glucosides-specific IIC component [Trichococcus ilyis]